MRVYAHAMRRGEGERERLCSLTAVDTYKGVPGSLGSAGADSTESASGAPSSK